MRSNNNYDQRSCSEKTFVSCSKNDKCRFAASFMKLENRMSTPSSFIPSARKGTFRDLLAVNSNWGSGTSRTQTDIFKSTEEIPPKYRTVPEDRFFGGIMRVGSIQLSGQKPTMDALLRARGGNFLIPRVFGKIAARWENALLITNETTWLKEYRSR